MCVVWSWASRESITSYFLSTVHIFCLYHQINQMWNAAFVYQFSIIQLLVLIILYMDVSSFHKNILSFSVSSIPAQNGNTYVSSLYIAMYNAYSLTAHLWQHTQRVEHSHAHNYSHYRTVRQAHAVIPMTAASHRRCLQNTDAFYMLLPVEEFLSLHPVILFMSYLNSNLNKGIY